MNKEILIKNLKHLRKSKGKTQAEMAEFLGITRSAYTLYETGVNTPPPKNLKRLADYFQVNIDTLIGKSKFLNDIRAAEDEVFNIVFSSAKKNPERWTNVELLEDGYQIESMLQQAIGPIPIIEAYVYEREITLSSIIKARYLDESECYLLVFTAFDLEDDEVSGFNHIVISRLDFQEGIKEIFNLIKSDTLKNKLSLLKKISQDLKDI